MSFKTLALFGLATAIAFSAGFYVAWHRDNSIFQAVKSASSRFRPWSRAEIVLLGDSITASGKWKQLFPRAEIENQGVAGEGTAAVLARLDDVLRLRAASGLCDDRSQMMRRGASRPARSPRTTGRSSTGWLRRPR